MKKIFRFLLPALLGAGYAALIICLSQLMVRGLAGLAARIGPLMGLTDSSLSYAVQVLDQLKAAVILSPWLPCLAIGALLGLAAAWLAAKGKGFFIAAAVLAVVLFIPLALGTLYFTFVNGICVGSLVKVLLPIVPHLL